MSARQFISWALLLLILSLTGCSGGDKPVNLDKDRPKKENEKEKDK